MEFLFRPMATAKHSTDMFSLQMNCDANNILNLNRTAFITQVFFFVSVILFINAISVLAQPCTPYPGYTTWMGYTDAWEDSANWCPAIAPVTANQSMNVRLTGGPSGPYTYFRPVIKSGVYAITNNLRIETGDTLFIQAANQSSLIVNDSLVIESVTSAIVVSNNSIKYPIFVRGHWENNGFFDAGESRVTFDGTISNQQIGGQSMSTFFDLEISNASHVLRLADFTVIDTLFLINGRLKLNLGMMTLLNPNPFAITRINGFIQSETDLLSSNVHPFGRLNWKMGNSPGLRVIPFINSFGFPIFLDYEIISGFHDVIVGTYGTYPNNTNLPLPEVTNVYSYFNGLIDSSGNSAVDRFYLLDNSMGTNPVAEVTFRYASAEQATNGNLVMGAQRWLNASNIWENPHLPMQVFYPGAGGNVHITISDSVFASSIWWTISSLSGALGTGLADVKNEELARVYPNPAYSGDILKLEIRDPSFKPDLVQLFTVDGREILIEDFQQGSHSIRIPFDLSSGVYTLMIKDIMKTGIMRLVIFDR